MEEFVAPRSFQVVDGGYQLFSTLPILVPISPVRKTREELADWCAENATVFANIKAPREDWLDFFYCRKSLTITLVPKSHPIQK